MKVKRTKEEQFVPVIITLETQDEVDQLFGVCNFAPLCDVIDIINKLNKSLDVFQDLKKSDKYFKKVAQILTTRD